MVEDNSRRKWRAELSSSKDRRASKMSFRLNPTFSYKGANKLSLLGRRKETNGVAIENSTFSTLFPTSSNTIDLVTPAVIDLTTPPKMGSLPPTTTTMDSAYYSAPSSVTKHSLSPERPEPAAVAPVAAVVKESPVVSSSISEYRSTMHKGMGAQFYKKVVKKQYRFPAQARESLQPIMRMVLQKPEDRPMVTRNYLILDIKNSKIRGETRKVRKPPRRSGERRTDGPNEEMTWYFGPKVGYN